MHEIAGYIAGFLTTICFIPQLFKIYVHRSAVDVSVWTYITLLLGELVWTIYGILEMDYTIITTNIVSSVLTVMIIAGCFLYGRPRLNQENVR